MQMSNPTCESCINYMKGSRVKVLLSDDKKYIKVQFKDENELEQVIVSNYEFILGPSSFYLPKSLIKTAEGARTIPDGFAVDIGRRQWYIIEAELLQHGVYEHISQQVTKQVLASSQEDTKKKIEELAVNQYNTDQTTKEKFVDESIKEIDVRKVLGDILQKPPIVGLPIDEVNKDLNQWALTFKNEIKIWIVSKFAELGNPNSIIYEFPEEFRPQIDTQTIESDSTIAQYDVRIYDLVKYGLIKPSDKLIMDYKPRNGNKKKYVADILPDGSLSLLSQTFSSPSFAALAGIQDAGSERKTVNGWTSWKTEEGKTLYDLREIFLNNRG